MSIQKQTTVSVVVPCYNGASYLEGTLQSALKQTHGPMEVIVVDDGSTDDSAAIAESVGHPVRVIRQENQGESVARNRGIDEAKGEWIAFLDADDLWSETKLQSQLSHLQEHNEQAVAGVCNVRFFGDVNQTAASWTELPEVMGSVEYICDFHSYLPSALIVRRDGAPRFPTWTRYGEDYLYSLELALNGTIDFVDKPLTHYRIHSSSQSAHVDSPVRQDKSFAKWIELNQERLGDRLATELRSRQLQALAARALRLRQTRKWEEFDGLRNYFNTLPQSEQFRELLPKRTLPKSLYRAVDVVDTLLPKLRKKRSEKNKEKDR